MYKLINLLIYFSLSSFGSQKLTTFSFKRFSIFNKLPLLEITVFTTWMLAKLSITLSTLYNIFWKCLPNFIIYGLLFAFAGISRNKKLALWLLQLLQMICFGNSSSWEARSWKLPQYTENSSQKYTAWNYLSELYWGFFFLPSSFLFFTLDWKHRVQCLFMLFLL